MISEETLTLPLLNRAGLSHFFGTKTLTEDQAKALHGGPSARLLQVHGDTVVTVGTTIEGRPTGDALMTDAPGVLITIFTADCLPVIIADPNRPAIAIVHAGWRGSLLRIVAKTVLAMTKMYGSDPATLLIGMGPKIGPCCFEVGREVWEQVAMEPMYSDGVLVRQQGEKGWIDLARLNRILLLNAGVKPENIADINLCTVCHPNLFHSYRRDKVKGQNMISGVGVRPPAGIQPSLGL